VSLEKIINTVISVFSPRELLNHYSDDNYNTSQNPEKPGLFSNCLGMEELDMHYENKISINFRHICCFSHFL
jgi:hypothetical protein